MINADDLIILYHFNIRRRRKNNNGQHPLSGLSNYNTSQMNYGYPTYTPSMQSYGGPLPVHHGGPIPLQHAGSLSYQNYLKQQGITNAGYDLSLKRGQAGKQSLI